MDETIQKYLKHNNSSPIIFNSMKKLLTLLFFSFFAMFSYAQLFTKIAHYDKFDDVIKEETRKTLITETDSTIVIEEKGREPVTYYIVNKSSTDIQGSKDDIVNLVADVYGYQTKRMVVRSDLIEKYQDAFAKYLQNSSHENLMLVASFVNYATHRTITTQYTGTYQTELFWLEDDPDNSKLGPAVSRIIYTRD